MREALDALELVVVIDVALTETGAARALRAAGAVAVREVGGDVLHARVSRTTSSSCARRSSPPLPGTLAEPEIHRRLVRAIGALDDADLAPLHAAAARRAARRSRRRSSQFTMERPELAGLAPVILYETLGPTLGAGNEAAALLWGAAHTCAHELSRVGAARRLRPATARRSARRSSRRSSRAAPA